MPVDVDERLVCRRCHCSVGPSVLVFAVIFAQEQILLVKRGTEPYVGKWAPPGGFVEAEESLEAAAAREVNEEVGLAVRPLQLIPHAIISLPKLNQVQVAFLAKLASPLAPRAALPEVVEGRWFSQDQYPKQDMWEPAFHFDIGRVFERVRTGRFELYQQNGDALRLINADSSITYL